jgi:hypothetical protein
MKNFKAIPTLESRQQSYERARAWLIAVAKKRIVPQSSQIMAKYARAYHEATHPCIPLRDDRVCWRILRELDGMGKYLDRLMAVLRFIEANEALAAWRQAGYPFGSLAYDAYYLLSELSLAEHNLLVKPREEEKLKLVEKLIVEANDAAYDAYLEEKERRFRREHPKEAAAEDAEIAAYFQSLYN